MEEEESRQLAGEIVLGADISEMSIEDIDERIAALEGEIERLSKEKANKTNHMDVANSFFKI